MSVPAWYQNAINDLGLTEGKGTANNPLVQKMYAATGYTNSPTSTPDSVPWCGAAMAYWMQKAKIPYFKRDAARARAWLDDPNFKAIKNPVIGAVGVVPRGKPPSGHVFMFAGWVEGSNKTKFRAIGANQSGGSASGHDGAVTMTVMRTEEVLGWRWPKSIPLPVEKQPVAKSGVVQAASAVGSTGVILAGANIPELAEAVQKADSASSTGTILGFIAGALIVGLAIYIVYARITSAKKIRKGSAD